MPSLQEKLENLKERLTESKAVDAYRESLPHLTGWRRWWLLLGTAILKCNFLFVLVWMGLLLSVMFGGATVTLWFCIIAIIIVVTAVVMVFAYEAGKQL